MAISTHATVTHLQNPLQERDKITKFISALTSFSSVEALRKDLEGKSTEKIKSLYTFHAKLESGKKSDVCALCQCDWQNIKLKCKALKDGVNPHLENHLNFFLALKEIDTKNQLKTDTAATSIGKLEDKLSKTDIGNNDVEVSDTQISIDNKNEITSAAQLVDAPNTCLTCFQMTHALKEPSGDSGPFNKMCTHIGHHKSEEQRSERVCIENAELCEKLFSSFKLLPLVRSQKKSYEQARTSKNERKLQNKHVTETH